MNQPTSTPFEISEYPLSPQQPQQFQNESRPLLRQSNYNQQFIDGPYPPPAPPPRKSKSTTTTTKQTTTKQKKESLEQSDDIESDNNGSGESDDDDYADDDNVKSTATVGTTKYVAKKKKGNNNKTHIDPHLFYRHANGHSEPKVQDVPFDPLPAVPYDYDAAEVGIDPIRHPLIKDMTLQTRNLILKSIVQNTYSAYNPYEQEGLFADNDLAEYPGAIPLTAHAYWYFVRAVDQYNLHYPLMNYGRSWNIQHVPLPKITADDESSDVECNPDNTTTATAAASTTTATQQDTTISQNSGQPANSQNEQPDSTNIGGSGIENDNNTMGDDSTSATPATTTTTQTTSTTTTTNTNANNNKILRKDVDPHDPFHYDEYGNKIKRQTRYFLGTKDITDCHILMKLYTRHHANITAQNDDEDDENESPEEEVQVIFSDDTGEIPVVFGKDETYPPKGSIVYFYGTYKDLKFGDPAKHMIIVPPQIIQQRFSNPLFEQHVQNLKSGVQFTEADDERIQAEIQHSNNQHFDTPNDILNFLVSFQTNYDNYLTVTQQQEAQNGNYIDDLSLLDPNGFKPLIFHQSTTKRNPITESLYDWSPYEVTIYNQPCNATWRLFHPQNLSPQYKLLCNPTFTPFQKQRSMISILLRNYRNLAGWYYTEYCQDKLITYRQRLEQNVVQTANTFSLDNIFDLIPLSQSMLSREVQVRQRKLRTIPPIKPPQRDENGVWIPSTINPSNLYLIDDPSFFTDIPQLLYEPLEQHRRRLHFKPSDPNAYLTSSKINHNGPINARQNFGAAMKARRLELEQQEHQEEEVENAIDKIHFQYPVLYKQHDISHHLLISHCKVVYEPFRCTTCPDYADCWIASVTDGTLFENHVEVVSEVHCSFGIAVPNVGSLVALVYRADVEITELTLEARLVACCILSDINVIYDKLTQQLPFTPTERKINDQTQRQSNNTNDSLYKRKDGLHPEINGPLNIEHVNDDYDDDSDNINSTRVKRALRAAARRSLAAATRDSDDDDNNDENDDEDNNNNKSKGKNQNDDNDDNDADGSDVEGDSSEDDKNIPKNTSNNNSSSTMADDGPKRRRGRPPKGVVVPPKSTQPDEPPKRRGRPPKAKDSTETTTTTTTKETKKYKTKNNKNDNKTTTTTKDTTEVIQSLTDSDSDADGDPDNSDVEQDDNKMTDGNDNNNKSQQDTNMADADGNTNDNNTPMTEGKPTYGAGKDGLNLFKRRSKRRRMSSDSDDDDSDDDSDDDDDTDDSSFDDDDDDDDNDNKKSKSKKGKDNKKDHSKKNKNGLVLPKHKKLANPTILMKHSNTKTIYDRFLIQHGTALTQRVRVTKYHDLITFHINKVQQFLVDVIQPNIQKYVEWGKAFVKERTAYLKRVKLLYHHPCPEVVSIRTLGFVPDYEEICNDFYRRNPLLRPRFGSTEIDFRVEQYQDGVYAISRFGLFTKQQLSHMQTVVSKLRRLRPKPKPVVQPTAASSSTAKGASASSTATASKRVGRPSKKAKSGAADSDVSDNETLASTVAAANKRRSTATSNKKTKSNDSDGEYSDDAKHVTKKQKLQPEKKSNKKHDRLSNLKQGQNKNKNNKNDENDSNDDDDGGDDDNDLVSLASGGVVSSSKSKKKESSSIKNAFKETKKILKKPLEKPTPPPPPQADPEEIAESKKLYQDLINTINNTELNVDQRIKILTQRVLTQRNDFIKIQKHYSSTVSTMSEMLDLVCGYLHLTGMNYEGLELLEELNQSNLVIKDQSQQQEQQQNDENGQPLLLNDNNTVNTNNTMSDEITPTTITTTTTTTNEQQQQSTTTTSEIDLQLQRFNGFLNKHLNDPQFELKDAFLKKFLQLLHNYYNFNVLAKPTTLDEQAVPFKPPALINGVKDPSVTTSSSTLLINKENNPNNNTIAMLYTTTANKIQTALLDNIQKLEKYIIRPQKELKNKLKEIKLQRIAQLKAKQQRLCALQRGGVNNNTSLIEYQQAIQQDDENNNNTIVEENKNQDNNNNNNDNNSSTSSSTTPSNNLTITNIKRDDLKYGIKTDLNLKFQNDKEYANYVLAHLHTLTLQLYHEKEHYRQQAEELKVQKMEDEYYKVYSTNTINNNNKNNTMMNNNNNNNNIQKSSTITSTTNPTKPNDKQQQGSSSSSTTLSASTVNPFGTSNDGGNSFDFNTTFGLPSSLSNVGLDSLLGGVNVNGTVGGGNGGNTPGTGGNSTNTAPMAISPNALRGISGPNDVILPPLLFGSTTTTTTNKTNSTSTSSTTNTHTLSNNNNNNINTNKNITSSLQQQNEYLTYEQLMQKCQNIEKQQQLQAAKHELELSTLRTQNEMLRTLMQTYGLVSVIDNEKYIDEKLTEILYDHSQELYSYNVALYTKERQIELDKIHKEELEAKRIADEAAAREAAAAAELIAQHGDRRMTKKELKNTLRRTLRQQAAAAEQQKKTAEKKAQALAHDVLSEHAANSTATPEQQQQIKQQLQEKYKELIKHHLTRVPSMLTPPYVAGMSKFVNMHNQVVDAFVQFLPHLQQQIVEYRGEKQAINNDLTTESAILRHKILTMKNQQQRNNNNIPPPPAPPTGKHKKTYISVDLPKWLKLKLQEQKQNTLKFYATKERQVVLQTAQEEAERRAKELLDTANAEAAETYAKAQAKADEAQQKMDEFHLTLQQHHEDETLLAPPTSTSIMSHDHQYHHHHHHLQQYDMNDNNNNTSNNDIDDDQEEDEDEQDDGYDDGNDDNNNNSMGESQTHQQYQQQYQQHHDTTTTTNTSLYGNPTTTTTSAVDPYSSYYSSSTTTNSNNNNNNNTNDASHGGYSSLYGTDHTSLASLYGAQHTTTSSSTTTNDNLYGTTNNHNTTGTGGSPRHGAYSFLSSYGHLGDTSNNTNSSGNGLDFGTSTFGNYGVDTSTSTYGIPQSPRATAYGSRPPGSPGGLFMPSLMGQTNNNNNNPQGNNNPNPLSPRNTHFD